MKLGSEKDLMKDHLEQEKGNWSDLLADIVIDLLADIVIDLIDC